jgi:hypothetical protein
MNQVLHAPTPDCRSEMQVADGVLCTAWLIRQAPENHNQAGVNPSQQRSKASSAVIKQLRPGVPSFLCERPDAFNEGAMRGEKATLTS